MEKGYCHNLLYLLQYICVFVLFFYILGCESPQVPIGNELIKNYPELGWEMFPTPRAFDNPGTIIGVKENGEKNVIDIHKFEGVKAQEEIFPEVKIIENQVVGIGAMAQFIINDAPANLGLSASDRRAIDVSMEI